MCHYFSSLYRKNSSAYNTSIEIIEKVIVLELRQSGPSSIVLLPARDITRLWQLVQLCTGPPALDCMAYKVFGPALCMAYHVIYICCSIVVVGPQDKVPKLLEDHTMEGEINSLLRLQSAGSWTHTVMNQDFL